MSAIAVPDAGRSNIITNTLTIARRNLLHIKATPEQLVEMSIQPLMFLVLFVYVSGCDRRLLEQYLQFALPASWCRLWRSCRSRPRSRSTSTSSAV
jgi:hypothetical protein